MNITAQVRRENLIRLVEEKAGGNRSEFARLVGTQSTYISQICSENPSKNLGADLASRIEELFGLPKGWMSMPHGSEIDTVSSMILDELGAVACRPIIDWADIKKFLSGKVVKFHGGFPVPGDVSENTFCTRLRGDSIQELASDGDMIAVDPQQHPQSYDFALISIEGGQPQALQVVQHGNDFIFVNSDPKLDLPPIKSAQYEIIGKILFGISGF